MNVIVDNTISNTDVLAYFENNPEIDAIVVQAEEAWEMGLYQGDIYFRLTDGNILKIEYTNDSTVRDLELANIIEQVNSIGEFYEYVTNYNTQKGRNGPFERIGLNSQIEVINKE